MSIYLHCWQIVPEHPLKGHTHLLSDPQWVRVLNLSTHICPALDFISLFNFCPSICWKGHLVLICIYLITSEDEHLLIRIIAISECVVTVRCLEKDERKVLISCLRIVKIFSNYICRRRGSGERTFLKDKINSFKISYLYLNIWGKRSHQSW